MSISIETFNLHYGIGNSLSNKAKFAGLIKIGFTLALLSLGGPLLAVDFLAEGEKQLSLNNPKKALTFLEAALAQGNATEKLYLGLGLTYVSLGMNESAQKSFQAGADLLGPARGDFLFNLGVAKARAKDFLGAEKVYSTLIAENPTIGEAILNRANLRLELRDFDHSLEDYRNYQKLVPDNAQKDKIDQLIVLLEEASLESKALLLTEQARNKQESDAQGKLQAQASGSEASKVATGQQVPATGLESAKVATGQQAQGSGQDSIKVATGQQSQSSGSEAAKVATEQQAQAGTDSAKVATGQQAQAPGQDLTKVATQQQGQAGTDAAKVATGQQSQSSGSEATKDATQQQSQSSGSESAKVTTGQQSPATGSESTEFATNRAKLDDLLARIRETLAVASQDAKYLLTGPATLKSDGGDFSLDP